MSAIVHDPSFDRERIPGQFQIQYPENVNENGHSERLTALWLQLARADL